MSESVVYALQKKGVRPSAQRVAVAQFVLSTRAHPTAEQVASSVRKRFPQISRATIYNTLNLFVEKGLLRTVSAAEGKIVFDPIMEKHHHFIDERTGKIFDIPWEALSVRDVHTLAGFEVSEYQVVLRGKTAKEKAK